MLPRTLATLLALLAFCGALSAQGKKLDYDVNEKTKFLGPRGGESDKGIKDDRLVKDAELTLVVAGNNRTLREVRLSERKAK